MYKHKDIRVPGVGTHVKMHGIAKGPTAGHHIVKRLMVKCIFGTSAAGTNLSLSRSLVNQVKGIYCLRSQLTS